MRKYIPMVIISERDPERADRIRLSSRNKRRRLRASDPDGTRAAARALYAKNPVAHIARKTAWKEANPEKVKETRFKYWKTNRARYLVTAIRNRAKQKGIAFDLTYEWMKARLDNGHCEMSGLLFDLENPRTKNSPSIDRRVPGGPYTQENCRMVLWSINRALSNWGDEYLIDVFKHVLDRRGK